MGCRSLEAHDPTRPRRSSLTAWAQAADVAFSFWSCSRTASGVSRRFPLQPASSERARSAGTPEIPESTKSERPRGGHQPMSASATRTSLLPRRSGAGHPSASALRRETASKSSRNARPVSVEANGTRSSAREEIPRAASLSESSRHAAAASGARTATLPAPRPAAARTSSAMAPPSAVGPAGRSARNAPAARTGRSHGSKSDPSSSVSSAGRPETGTAASISSETSTPPSSQSPRKSFASMRPRSMAGASPALRHTKTSRAPARSRARALWAQGSSLNPDKTTGDRSPSGRSAAILAAASQGSTSPAPRSSRA